MVPQCSRSDHCPTEHVLRRPRWKTKSLSEHRLPGHDSQGPRTRRVGVVTQPANVASAKRPKRVLGQSENAAKRSRARVAASQACILVENMFTSPTEFKEHYGTHGYAIMRDSLRSPNTPISSPLQTELWRADAPALGRTGPDARMVRKQFPPESVQHWGRNPGQRQIDTVASRVDGRTCRICSGAHRAWRGRECPGQFLIDPAASSVQSRTRGCGSGTSRVRGRHKCPGCCGSDSATACAE